MHNWNAPEAIKILRHLREAAVPGKTKLMIIEKVITYACKGVIENSHDIEGLVTSSAPEPLLGNFGWVLFTFCLPFDLLMMGQSGLCGDLLDRHTVRVQL